MLLTQFSHEQLHLLDEILGKTKLALVKTDGDAGVRNTLGDMLGKIRRHPFYKSNEYAVNVTVVLQKEVSIQANSPDEALEIAKKMYAAGDIVIDGENFSDVSFEF